MTNLRLKWLASKKIRQALGLSVRREWERIGELRRDVLWSQSLGEPDREWQWRAWVLEKSGGEESRVWIGLDDVGVSVIPYWSWELKDGKLEFRLGRESEWMMDWANLTSVTKEGVTEAMLRAVRLILEGEYATNREIAEWVEGHVERDPLWGQGLTVREALRVVGVPKTGNEVKRFWMRLIVGDLWERTWGGGRLDD